MRRVGRFFLAALFALVLVVSGCSEPSAESGKSAKPKANTEVKKEEKKEPTPLEVLEKAKSVMEQGGYKFDGKIRQKMAAGSRVDLDMSIKFTVEMINQPLAFHMKGKLKTMGRSFPVESYVVDGTRYMKVSRLGWTKSNEPDLASETEQNPSDAMKKLARFIEELGGNGLPEGVTVTKSAPGYVIEIDYSKFMKDPKFKQKTIEKIKEELDMKYLKQRGIRLKPDQLKIVKMKEKSWINGTTFKAEKITMEMDLVIPTNRKDLIVKQDMELLLKGDYSGKIVVPEKVKKMAKPER
jgi:hypothetical protein